MTFFKTLTLVGAALGAAAFFTAPAAASDDDKPNVTAQFFECSGVDDDDDRLDCYDDLAKSMKKTAANTSEPQKTLTTAQIENFGAEGFAENDELDEIERLSRIEYNVTSIRMTAARKLKITLENGQVWSQTPDDKTIQMPDPGVQQKASIRRALFGRYLLRLEPEGKTIKVKREE